MMQKTYIKKSTTNLKIKSLNIKKLYLNLIFDTSDNT